MIKRVAGLVVGLGLGVLVAFGGAGGCDSVQNEFNCTDLCNRYQSCFDKSYDTSTCSSRCTSAANNNQNFDQQANSCQNCMNQNSCAGAALACPSCTGIVP